MASLPKPRGPLSEALVAALVSDRTDIAYGEQGSPEDGALALWILYELSYRGYDEVDDRLEFDPGLVRLRRRLEDDLEQRLRERWPGRPSYEPEQGFAAARSARTVKGFAVGRTIFGDAARAWLARSAIACTSAVVYEAWVGKLARGLPRPACSSRSLAALSAAAFFAEASLAACTRAACSAVWRAVASAASL